MEDIQNPFETVIRQNSQILYKLERLERNGQGAGEDNCGKSLTQSKVGNHLSIGIAVGITIFSLLGGLALTIKALKKLDLKLILELNPGKH